MKSTTTWKMFLCFDDASVGVSEGTPVGVVIVRFSPKFANIIFSCVKLMSVAFEDKTGYWISAYACACVGVHDGANVDANVGGINGSTVGASVGVSVGEFVDEEEGAFTLHDAQFGQEPFLKSDALVSAIHF